MVSEIAKIYTRKLIRFIKEYDSGSNLLVVVVVVVVVAVVVVVVVEGW